MTDQLDPSEVRKLAQQGLYDKEIAEKLGANSNHTIFEFRKKTWNFVRG